MRLRATLARGLISSGRVTGKRRNVGVGRGRGLLPARLAAQARHPGRRRCAYALCCIAPASTESAIANGDTRTISFVNEHTNESGSFTYLR